MKNKVVILSTQRSGSTMICDDIAGTNKLGIPSEYFVKIIDSGIWERKLIEKELERIQKNGETENGISSIKIMSNQMESINKILKKTELNPSRKNLFLPLRFFYEFYKNALYIRVYREDKVAQAISRIRAKKTGFFHLVNNHKEMRRIVGSVVVNKSKQDDPDFNLIEIKNEIKKIEKEEKNLDKYILKNKIDSFDVKYEDAVEDRGYIFVLANKLRVDGIKLVDRRLTKMAGKHSRKWAEKYKQEYQ